MTKHYEKEYLVAGSSIDHVVEELQEHNAAGRFVSVDFNGIELFSDTVTLDDAYLKVTGKTKSENDQYLEDTIEKLKLEQKEHERKIPELTAHWIAKGNELIPEVKQSAWAELVSVRLNDIYKGKDLEHALALIALLKNDEPVEKVEEQFFEQSHSGMSGSIVCLIVKEFTDRGPEFFSYMNK